MGDRRRVGAARQRGVLVSGRLPPRHARGRAAIHPRGNPEFAILVNGLFLVLVLAAAAIGTASLLFSLSIVALVGVNGVGHCLATLRLGRYMPGTITGATLYLPLAPTATSTQLATRT